MAIITDDTALVARLMGELDVNDASQRKPSFREKVHNAIPELLHHATSAAARADRMKAILDEEDELKISGHMELSSLMSMCEKVASAAHGLSKVLLDYIVNHLTLLGDPDATQKAILSHFDDEIREVVRSALSGASNGGELWKVAEAGYNQSLSKTGALHADSYYTSHDEAALGWPYDIDFESEEYYEHENRLGVDENYARAFQRQCDQRSEDRSKRNDNWVWYWVTVLHECTGGPTLFHPPESGVEVDNPRVSHKLMRTFDENSSGINTDAIIASVMSRHDLVGLRRVDLLQLPKKEAATRLYKHLTKSLIHGSNTDNLMSWTSSPLFAIQYAIYRCYAFGSDPSGVKICLVDPKDFPRGQFARDMALIKACQGSVDVSGQVNAFFSFRLENARYDNGEYLSQGRLNIEGRSCITTLEELIEAGLYELYPQLEDSDGARKWANRVLDLRTLWSIPQTTTTKEIKVALRLAKRCFGAFTATDIAAMLLAFKSRKLTDFAAGLQQNQRKLHECGPAEVQRGRSEVGKDHSLGLGGPATAGWIGGEKETCAATHTFYTNYDEPEPGTGEASTFLFTMGFDCGFDIYPPLEANGANIRAYQQFLKEVAERYSDIYDDGGRESDGKILVLPGDQNKPQGFSGSFIWFMVGECPRIPSNPDHCSCFLRFSSKVSGRLTTPAAKYITGVCDIAVKHFGIRVHSWHEMNESGDERLRHGCYGWQEVHDAWKQVKELDERLAEQVSVDQRESGNVNN